MCPKAADGAYPPDYVAYLLRLWRVRAGGEETWRASLEDPHTGEQMGFAGFGELFSFLQDQTSQAPDKNRDEGPIVQRHPRVYATRRKEGEQSPTN